MASAATPATAGDAMLVPLLFTYALTLPFPAAAAIWTPDPTTCGRSRPSTVGPWLLKSAILPSSATAPTASVFLAAA